jgi:hypothetical protein
MKTVNLLPDWYLNERRRSRALRTQLMAIGTATVLGAACLAVLQWQTGRMARTAGQLAAEVAAGQSVVAQLAANEEKLHRMEAQQAAFRDVGVPVPMSRVAQQILNNLTPGEALCGFTIDVHSEAQHSGGGTSGKAKMSDVAHLTIDGIAPDSVRIAQLIGKLSANPLFSEITLNFSRSELLRDYAVKRFEILMQLDMDQLAIPDTAPDVSTAARCHAPGESHAG